MAERYRRTQPRLTPKKGRVLVVYGISTLEDVYGVVRMNIPYRPKADYPDGLDCTSADDVFRLFFRYTEERKLGYMSSTERELHRDGTHAEKVANEINQRHGKIIVLERGKKEPEWLTKALSMTNAEVVRTMPARAVPPGVDRDKINYFEAMAWRLIYAWALKQPWPKTQLELQTWRPVGQGKDVKIVGEEKRPRQALRQPTPEEITQIEKGELTIADLLATGVRLNAHGRQMAANAQSKADFDQAGIWKTHVLYKEQMVLRSELPKIVRKEQEG